MDKTSLYNVDIHIWISTVARRAGYRRTDLVRAIGLFDLAVEAAIPSVASVPEFLQGCKVIYMGVTPCEMVP